METRANYVVVGLFVVALAAGLFGFAVWLAKTQFETNVVYYDIYFTGPITGLKKGSVVSYHGITVGDVSDIEIDPKNLERVLVTIEVKASTPVRVDTVASIEIQGIAGIPYILLTGGMKSSPPLVKTPGERYPVIASAPSKIEQVLAGAPATVERINILLARANELLSAENREAVTRTLQNLNKTSDAIAAHIGDFESTAQDTAKTLANIRDASAALERTATQLEADSARLTESADRTMGAFTETAKTMNSSVQSVTKTVNPMLTQMRDAAESTKKMADQIDAMVAENRQPLRDFSSGGLVELVSLLSETRQLVGNLNRLTAEIERDPARFFFGNRQGGYEANKPQQ